MIPEVDDDPERPPEEDGIPGDDPEEGEFSGDGDPGDGDPGGGDPGGGDPAEGHLDDLPVPPEDLEIDGDGDDEEEEEEEEGEDEDPATPDADAPVKPKPKSKSKDDEDAEIAHPDTPVPTRAVMRKALDWAFAEEEGIEDDLLERFTTHALALLEKNRVMNLTAVLDPKELAAKHYLDSWRVTRLVPLIARKVLDLGTGGGFPGIPVALAEPNLSMTLCDRTKKKVDWLVEICQELGAKNCHPVWAPAEEYLAKERVDIVLVRAVSSVRENVRTLRKVRHSLKDMVMLKGPAWSREVRAAEREAERLGFKLDTVWEHELPDEMGKRAILVYRAPGGAGS